MPQVSVILPVFNAEKTIARAVDSMLAQTLKDIELIVVDDGSTDDTAKTLAAIKDDRLKVITAGHAGVIAASNLAFKHSTSQFVARMDADDFSYPDRLQSQLDLLQQKQLDVVGCQVRIVHLGGYSVASLKRYERWINSETLTSEQIMALRFVELPLVNPTICARREYFEREYQDNHLPEDYNLMLQAAEAGMRFGKVNQVLFDWSDSSGRLTRNDKRYSDEAFMECRRVNLLAGPLNGVECVDVWGAGKTGKSWIRWLQSQHITIRQIFEVDQRKIGTQIHGCPVIDCEAMPMCDGVPLIVAVGTDGIRQRIWDHVTPKDYRPGVDTWFVA